MATGPAAPQVPLEEQVALLKQQLAQAQRLTALGELVSTTTHEFNNVLTTVINYAQMGLRHKDDATREKAFEKILSAGQRAARISRSILGCARNRSSRMEPTELATVIDDTLVLLERELQKYRIVVDRALATVPPAVVNANQIQQVLINLLINARQAMPNGGRLLVRLEHDATAQMVDLTIRDTGTGMPPEVLRRIFDPFFSTKSGPDESGKGGSGLGLAMCREIIEAHQGRIRVESSVGKGTAFTLKLPAATTAAASGTTPTTASSPVSSKTPAIGAAPVAPAAPARTTPSTPNVPGNPQPH